MEVEFDLNNILDADEIDNLFSEEKEDEQDTQPEEKEEKETNEETTEVDPEELFEDSPESVGSGKENIEEKGDSNFEDKANTSPKNFYSSIAEALATDGIFPDLDKDTFENIKTPEDLRDVINQQIEAGLTEKQKRISDALDLNIEVSNIKKFENTIDYLDSIDDDTISDEGEEGEKLRKALIYQDLINKNFKPERAQREVEKSFNAGTDIDDAKEALANNKEFYKDSYDSLIKESKEKENERIKLMEKQAEDLKKSILEDKKAFGEVSLDSNTRKKVFENISKAVYKDPDSGEYMTALQKYQKENSIEFLKNIGLLFTLTDGFKSLDNLVKGKVKKEMSKGLRELEHTINNTRRTSDGNLKFTSGVSDDPESFLGKKWDLDI